MQVAVAGQMYSYAIAFIKSNEILEIDPQSTYLSTLDYLGYFYYSGLWYHDSYFRNHRVKTNLPLFS